MAASAAPFAAYVMDARSGKEIYAQNADTRLHPASLTKMMTLYLAFTAIERGQVRLDTKFLVSQHAAGQQPSRLGLKAGQRIELRYLIRAAAVKSANDAATAIGEGLGGGSEAVFARQMTAMAQAIGMRNTSFRNANGLTTEGHYSTARDMSTLGRRLFYDFPQYYSIFSRRSADAGIANVANTNRRFLDEYEGADGIKTGYTRAAGFNLTASAKRGNKRIIATVFGGQSTAHRNQVMKQLLDTGFGKAPTRVKEVKPEPPQYMVQRDIKRTIQVARAEPAQAAPEPFKISTSARPMARANTASVVNPGAIVTAIRSSDNSARESDDAIAASSRPQRRPGSTSSAVVATKSSPISDADIAEAPEARAAASGNGLSTSARPARKGKRGSDEVSSLDPALAPALVPASVQGGSAGSIFLQTNQPQPETLQLASHSPARREDTIILASMAPELEGGDPMEATEVVSRVSSGGGKAHGVSLGLYTSQSEAEQLLLRTSLQENAALGTALRRVGNTKRGFEASFTGMSKASARLACDRLQARHQACTVIGP